MSASEELSTNSSNDSLSSGTESDISLDPAMPGPYSFEPSASDTETGSSSSSVEDDEDSNRLTDMSWYVYK